MHLFSAAISTCGVGGGSTNPWPWHYIVPYGYVVYIIIFHIYRLHIKYGNQINSILWISKSWAYQRTIKRTVQNDTSTFWYFYNCIHRTQLYESVCKYKISYHWNNDDVLNKVCLPHCINTNRVSPMAAQSKAWALRARTLDRGFESRLVHGCFFFVSLLRRALHS
jgi:hypothetical protein